jgi:hypothetical protein
LGLFQWQVTSTEKALIKSASSVSSAAASTMHPESQAFIPRTSSLLSSKALQAIEFTLFLFCLSREGHGMQSLRH